MCEFMLTAAFKSCMCDSEKGLGGFRCWCDRGNARDVQQVPPGAAPHPKTLKPSEQRKCEASFYKRALVASLSGTGMGRLSAVASGPLACRVEQPPLAAPGIHPILDL